MEKYQEALNELKDLVHSELDGTKMLNKYLVYCNTLQELVDKATPKNVILYTSEITNSEEAYSFYTCPECRRYVGGENYCPKCGQALDWSDNNE